VREKEGERDACGVLWVRCECGWTELVVLVDEGKWVVRVWAGPPSRAEIEIRHRVEPCELKCGKTANKAPPSTSREGGGGRWWCSAWVCGMERMRPSGEPNDLPRGRWRVLVV
jgi:hypothetical protein